MRGRNGIANFFLVAGLCFIVAGLYAVRTGEIGGSIAALTYFIIGVIWAVVGAGIRAMYAGMQRSASAEQELFDAGTKAPAVIERVETTGMVLNHVNVRIVLRLRVQPRSEPEFTHERKMFVPFNALPRVGDVIEVAYDPEDKSKVALATDWASDTAGGRFLDTRPPGDATNQPPGWQSNSALDTAYEQSDPEAESGPDRIIGQLERLQRLRQDGVLTEAEFEVQKAKILAEPGS